MNALIITGTAPVELLAEIGFIPEGLIGKAETMPFAFSLFQTRASRTGVALGELIGFHPDDPDTYHGLLKDLPIDDYTLTVDLPELIEQAGEPRDLEIFEKLRTIPDARFIVDYYG